MAAKAVLTSEDLERIQSATGKTFELVRGELYEVVPPNPRHGGVALLIAFLLETWNRLSNTGW